MINKLIKIIPALMISAVIILQGIPITQSAQALEIDKIDKFELPDVNSEESIGYQVDQLVNDAEYTSSEIIVKYNDQERTTLIDIEGEEKGTLAESDEQIDVVRDKLTEYLVKKKNSSEIEFVQPNYKYDWHAWSESTPDDYDSTKHWYLRDSNVIDLWTTQGCSAGATCGGDSAVVVAVLDSGVAYTSGVYATYDTTGGGGAVLTDTTYTQAPELSSVNWYVNSDETHGDGDDDDSNGYSDDRNGADMFPRYYKDSLTGADATNANIKEGTPVDTYGHGTLVTQMIAANTGNTAGTVAPAFNTSIMPVAVGLPFGGPITTLMTDGIYYAIDEGADVITISIGALSHDASMKLAIDYAEANGVVVIASSGNIGGSYSNSSIVYPASYDNVISVGSASASDTKASHSITGHGVDITAYVGNGGAGDAVYGQTLTCMISAPCTPAKMSTFSFQYQTGTSFAAPQVAAAAALIKSAHPGFTPEQVRWQLLNTSTDISTAGYDKSTGWGVLDYNAVIGAQNTYPKVTSGAVYRFMHKVTKFHFYTASAGERDSIIANLSSIWQYEGQVFTSYNGAASDRQPVHQFVHKVSRLHFYTANEGEKASVIANLSSIWQYEGIVFYVYKDSPGHTKMHRFEHREQKYHLYTASEGEKAWVIANLSSVWEYEGVVYYVD